MNWMKQQLANVAGTSEPIYGPSAIHSVKQQNSTKGYTELSRDDMRWAVMDSTCVETQTFYITAATGHIAMAQVIYSNVAGIKITTQFNTKVFYPDGTTSPLWTSDPLEHHAFDSTKMNFSADNCSVTASEDGESYTIKSTTSKKNIVDLKFTKLAPGFVVGENGTTTYGTDVAKPWGRMRHAFWPRCKVEGTFVTQSGVLNMGGQGLFIHALQGMKPHHAAAQWTFANFQSPTYSAIMMEYTTPPSYGTSVVNVAGIAVDGKILCANSDGTAKHKTIEKDAEVGWPAPSEIDFVWTGTSADGKDVKAELSGPLEKRIDRVDVMAEVPKFVKQIVANAAGTKPYIYQYGPKLTLKINVGGEEKEEQGTLFSEATFITAV